MSTKRINFLNNQGLRLSAILDLPDSVRPHNWALFAHCFTCGKDLIAAQQISRGLNSAGIAVLRFDFTGLGQSDGHFEETVFASNIDDLLAADTFLAEHYQPATLIVGHSLGGAAAIFAASRLPGVRAVVTIGTPSSPEHVQHLFHHEMDAITTLGVANIDIGGRPFPISRALVDDLRDHDMPSVISQLGKALLVLHSPQDSVVSIHNAEEIYRAARHPKSYISLEGADHLLSRRADSYYVGQIVGSWATRYLDIPKLISPTTHHQVAVSLGNNGYTCEVVAGKHHLTADEPVEAGGTDYGPAPYEYLSVALGACTAMTLRMYADRKGWDLQKVVVHLDHGKEYPATYTADPRQKIDQIRRNIELAGSLDEVQRQRLLEIADRCPVHRSLEKGCEILTDLKPPET